MADPKKPEDDKIKPEDMAYPTPKLDPQTGAPLDTRFQNDTSQEVTVNPSPKSGAKQAQESEDEGADDKKTKGKEKPRTRR